MIDISTLGAGITIISLTSFPMGFRLSAFADDMDSLVIEPTEVSGFEKLYDGTIFGYDKTSPVLLAVGVIPNSDDDVNMKILLQKRKSNPTYIALLDTITMVVSYGDGGRVILSSGVILSGSIADSMQSSGRRKGNVYNFAFGSFDGFQSKKQAIGNLVGAGVSIARNILG
jgi:hypothetical protein